MQTDSKEILTKDELVEWFLHPVTKKVRYKIEREIQSCQDRLSSGWAIDFDSAEKTALLTVKEIGMVEGLSFLFNMEADE